MVDRSVRRKIRVLHLEDSPLDAELIAENLKADGLAISVKRVETRDEFTTCVTQGGFDLILADHALPAFDGLSALAIATETAPETPFVFVSGTLGEETAIESLKRGATDYVLKHRLHRLPSAVSRALAEAREKAERQRAEAALRALNAVLETRVAERTRELGETNRLLLDEIAERRQVQAALHESEARYRALLEHSPDGIFVVEMLPGGGVRYETGNPAFRRLVGREEAELRGGDLRAILVQDVGSNVEHYLRCVERGEAVHFDYTVERSSGALARETILVPLPDASGQVTRLIGSARDVTARRQAEERLRQAQKMEAVGQLTSGVAHDFNNLLTVILGNLELVEKQLTEAPERVRRAAAMSMQAAERAAGLTQRLLAFARRQPLDPRPTDANRLLAGMADLLRRTLGDAIVVETRLCDELWWTRVDSNQLENAILNLAVNSRDAMPKGGTVTISTRNGRLDGPGSEFVAIRVADTGTGMSEEVRQRVLEPFFTTKDVGQGTGLGLSQVYGFVQQSGGTLDISSELGRGTAVEIRLPRLAGEEAALADRLSHAGAD